MKPSSAANDNLIERTTALWQPRLGRELTREDAWQIAKDVAGFFSMLHEWSKGNDNDNRESAAATDSGEARRDRAWLWKREGRRVRIARLPRGMDFDDLLVRHAPRIEESAR